MPVITVNGGKMTKEQKEQLVKELVSKSSEVLNIPEEAFVTIIQEHEFDNIGNGTQLLSEKFKKQ